MTAMALKITHTQAEGTLIEGTSSEKTPEHVEAGTLRPYALEHARRYIRNQVSTSPSLGKDDATVINIETSLGDPGVLFLDLDDGSRIELKIRRYMRE